VTQQVSGAFLTAQLEVAMIDCQPLVEHLGDLNGALAEVETARRLLAPMTGVTLDIYRNYRVRMAVSHDFLFYTGRRNNWLAGDGSDRRIRTAFDASV
jgi:hypothetical protein